MCRLDDDCAWYVDSDNASAVSETVEVCEDCGRNIMPGDPHTRFSAMPGEDYDGPQERWIWVAQDPEHCHAHQRKIHQITGPDAEELRNLHTWKSWDPTKTWFKIQEDDQDVWESLGFRVFEEENELEPEIHISCSQCRIANRWLETICRQHVVMVTREDLLQHLGEYGNHDPEVLGPEFRYLAHWVSHKWELWNGQPLSVHTVSMWTTKAIDFAVRAGLQEMAQAY